MARTYRLSAAQSPHSRRSISLACGELPQGVRRARPVRRSARFAQYHTAHQTQPPLLPQEYSDLHALSQASTYTQPADRKRKRASEADTSDRLVQKRHKEAASDSIDSGNPVDYWRKHQHWPRDYFDPEGNMSYPLSRKKSTSSLRRRGSTTSNTSDTTASDDKSRESNSSVYNDKRYDSLLAAHNSFMNKDELGTSRHSKMLCKELLETEQPVPQDSLFDDDLFDETCDYLRNRSETIIRRDIGLLIVPSAIHLARRGAKHLKILAETADEAWSESIRLFKPRPQPDYGVGFKSSAFLDEQRKRLQPFIGGLKDESFFAATWYMYFPFLTCEVKSSVAALDIADRQNAHSMTLAVRAIVELFKLVKREKEIDREILAFSISHDHTSVRIYGYYPVIDGKDTKYYRHLIDKFDFTARGGKDKWTTYKFVKNVYDNWMPDHFKRICSAIDEIPPDINFDISQGSDVQSSSQTGLSQKLESHHFSQSEGSVSVASQDNGSSIGAENPTPDTSISQVFKKPRRL